MSEPIITVTQFSGEHRRPTCAHQVELESAHKRIAELEREAELSKQVVTAHRKLCDERAAKIKELEAELRVWKSRAEQAEAAREAVREFTNTGGDSQ